MAAEPLFLVGLIADIQYSDKEDEEGRKHYRAALPKARQCVKWLNAEHSRNPLALTINLGDIVDGSHEPGPETLRELEDVKSVLNVLETPLAHVIGNHCLYVDATKPELLRSLNHQHGVGYGKVLQRDGFRLFILDGTDGGTMSHPQGSPGYQKAKQWLDDHPLEEYSYAQTWNSALSEGQTTWLTEQLEETRLAGDKAILFSHYPLLPGTGGTRHLLWNKEDVLALIGRYKEVVVAHVSGHYHRGGIDRKDGVHHVTIPSVLESPPSFATPVAILKVYTDHIQLYHGPHVATTEPLSSSELSDADLKYLSTVPWGTSWSF